MIIGLIIAVVVAAFVKKDWDDLYAQGIVVGKSSLRRNGPPSSWAWFIGVSLLLIVCLPLYLYERSKAINAARPCPPPLPAPAPSGYCKDCGRPLPAPSAFCPGCGSELARVD